MATEGKIVTLLNDDKTMGIFPKTKISAISNNDGVGLDAILEELMAGGSGGGTNNGDEIYIGDEEANATAPLNADTLGGRHADYYTRPYNLLDNSDFRNPVNQRGVTSGASYPSWTYTIDRWTTGNATSTSLSFGSNGVTIVGALYQYIMLDDRHRKLTLAIKVNGQVYACSGNYTASDTWVRLAGINTENFSVVLDNDNGERILVAIQSPETASVVEWVALYEGEYTVETLPPYYPKGYVHELMECQRYYQLLKIAHYRTAGSETRGQLFFQLPIPMRSSPNLSLLNGGLVLADYATPAISNIVETSCYAPYDSGSFIVDLASSTEIDGTSPGWSHRYIWVDGSIAFSADL